MIRIKHRGSFKNTERFFERVRRARTRVILEKYSSAGILALANATPKDTSETANSWRSEIKVTSRGYKIEWYNTHVHNGVPIAIIIQYGHGTGTGGYVPPNDYINPAMKSIFDNMAEELWKEVSGI